jgi:hypothetical protein
MAPEHGAGTESSGRRDPDERQYGRTPRAFLTKTGRPISWQRDEPDEPRLRWYDFVCSYAAAKWPYPAPKHRRGIAEALTDVTEVMVRPDEAAPSRDDLRRALREWTFSDLIRNGKKPAA